MMPKRHIGILLSATLLTIALTLVWSTVQTVAGASPAAQSTTIPTWLHLSSANGDLPSPAASSEQTAALVLDIDKDGLNDFVIGTRKSPGPSVMWYQRTADGWTRYVIESDVLRIEAGGAFFDIDDDGDLDVVLGRDGSGNEIWWWENPYPNYDPTTDWVRRTIKSSGVDQHHDMMFGDFDDDAADRVRLLEPG